MSRSDKSKNECPFGNERHEFPSSRNRNKNKPLNGNKNRQKKKNKAGNLMMENITPLKSLARVSNYFNGVRKKKTTV